MLDMQFCRIHELKLSLSGACLFTFLIVSFNKNKNVLNLYYFLFVVPLQFY